MKVAVLGGGFTGLTASYYLAKKGHSVTLFEKEQALGGLAVGFKQPGWSWYLERALHHLLGNDDNMVSLAKESGFEGIFWQKTLTASYYKIPANFPKDYRTLLSSNMVGAQKGQVIPVDTPQDFLKFPYISLPEKLRAGFILALLQFSPFLSTYEKQTAEEFLKKNMGNHVWEVIWEELFRKKFGKYAGNILASFIWARIKKRSKKLGYIKGGFQTFIDYLEQEIKKLNVEIKKGYMVNNVIKKGSGFAIDSKSFDAIISTLPSPILPKISAELFSTNYLSRFEKLKFLHAVSMVFETKEPLLDKVYWLNVCVSDNKIMGVMQHTNFIDKKHYSGNHILYAYNYVEFNDPRIRMDKNELLKFYLPELKKINPNFIISPSKSYSFKGPFAQPIFDKDFLKNKPDFETPVKNFYIANLDMTYPYDRGTNYAVKLGKEVAKRI